MYYKLVVYIPENYLEKVKTALFNAGAGRQGNYDNCCWQVLGTGQFRPLEGSAPYLGAKNELKQVSEWRVEILVAEDSVCSVKGALVETHPYEEPAYDFIACVDI